MSIQEKYVTDADELARNAFAQGIVGKVSYWIFHQRKALLALFILITAALGYSATNLKVEAGFFKMIPLHHEYMKTFLEYQKDFGGANKVLVSVKTDKGEIFTPEAMAVLRKVSDEVFFINGVERSSVTSLFTSNVRYTEVVEDGFTGGNLVDSSYSGTPQQIAQVRERTLKSDWVGRIVSNNLSSAMVVANLQETDPVTGQRLDLQDVANKLEKIRQDNQGNGISIHIIGFAKSIGDIAEGASDVLVFFIIAFVISALLLYWYCGSLMLTGWALICAMVPVVWLMGLLPLLKLTLDPMSILVPFLIFSIGVSHAVQMTNAWKLETLNGADGVTASRNCFQKLFVPGAVALLANALGFMVIALVDIEMVRELAITATLGVSVMIVTNKMLLPILLSFMRLSASDAQTLRGKETLGAGLWERLGVLATRRGAAWALLCAAVLLGWGLLEARHLHVGDIGAGVPELRPDSRYNQDVASITRDFAIGVDLLQVIVKAKGDETPCVKREVLDPINELDLYLRQDDGVSSVRSLAGFVGNITQAYAETDLKWRVLPEPTAQIAQGVGFATRVGTEYMNSACNAIPVSIYTKDHQADTISNLMNKIKAFKAAYDNDQITFQLASGNVGVMAATNEVVHAGDKLVNGALFASVTLLCLWMFRSLRITLCVIIPLALVTVLCNALMALLGIGVKVNTLPVVALGVGVGVDYGIYLFERIKHEMHDGGKELREAFVEALKQRGTASVFTAVTMTLSIATWAFSNLKFQADMGILLAFMFLVNMLGAILLLPALAAWLLPRAKN
ncbi:efflux RND transporter permease subunit [Pseudomonas sp. TNT2022 ID1044]|uniref:efflux RND transporter permease subunit n=1 Tax=Pseudomonas sp. TNT2022 ID1044 TaxID=2942636 RepID=UPI002360218F|nr:efflux RND transporter permease subunit [Pseudomonas sp. TNT2022 ID1044]MDD0996901.1 efflux RND transporter permease subunit [Pseudomonas sp. TNT2022 ID1044]